jgi:hypothetical protein
VAPIHREMRASEIDAVRRALGEAAFLADWSRGQALPLEDALDEALAVCAQPVLA